MTPAQEKLQSQCDRLRRSVADYETQLGAARTKLAKLEAQISDAPPPVTGLDLLWKCALPKARERSSKHLCRTEWNRIPKPERPLVEKAIAALKAWNRCEEWKKDGNAYVPGLHRWLKNRMWEDLPEGTSEPAPSRYRSTPQPIIPTAPEDAATRAEIAQFLSLKGKSL